MILVNVSPCDALFLRRKYNRFRHGSVMEEYNILLSSRYLYYYYHTILIIKIFHYASSLRLSGLASALQIKMVSLYPEVLYLVLYYSKRNRIIINL